MTVKEKIENYLKQNGLLRLATISPDGTPVVHTVAYASEGSVVYFLSETGKRKIQNIIKNPNVAYTVDRDYSNWGEIQGIQMTGKATVLNDQEDIERARNLLMKKHPPFTKLPPHDYSFVRIDPKTGYFLDNAVKFGHRDNVDY